jgi:hypothetical protein
VLLHCRGGFGELFERGGVVHGDVGEDFAIELDAGFAEL